MLEHITAEHFDPVEPRSLPIDELVRCELPGAGGGHTIVQELSVLIGLDPKQRGHSTPAQKGRGHLKDDTVIPLNESIAGGSISRRSFHHHIVLFCNALKCRERLVRVPLDVLPILPEELAASIRTNEPHTPAELLHPREVTTQLLGSFRLPAHVIGTGQPSDLVDKYYRIS